MRVLMFLFFTFIFTQSVFGQFGYGITAKTDLYVRYSNPEDGLASPSAGSALLNLGIGPKIWIGTENFTFSPEATILFSPLALSTGDFKGMGALSFPVIAKFHFLGLSNMNYDGKFGFAIGAGYQWSRTELYGLKDSFEEQGVSRAFFRTFVIEADFGFGLSGFNIHGILRYGFNKDLKANTFNFGIGYDFNLPMLREAADPEF